jgi:antitoxin (DNA-binding transcriptional repressor) of toxin-antitoxin stability system
MSPRLSLPRSSVSFRSGLRRSTALIGLFAATVGSAAAADWKVTQGPNEVGPGENVSVTVDGKLVARLIYGAGQQKPFVAIYDEQGRAITNAGVDKDGKPVGIEPHQRGIFVGWKVIESELGRLDPGVEGTGYKGNYADTWSMANGTTQELVEIERMATNDNSASIVARIEWRAGTKDASGSNLLMTETRRIRVYKPTGMLAQVDHTSDLLPARDLVLGADVQHAGAHMRVDASVYDRVAETSYLWAPANAEKAGKPYYRGGLEGATGSVKANNLKWGEFLFPLHDRWYSVTQMNGLGNPVEEFSTREYGRFGFFFKGAMKKEEALRISYRFLVKVAETPAEAPRRSAAQLARARQEAESGYVKFVHEVR